MKQKKKNPRREFLKTAGKTAIAAPAALLILNAAIKPSIAQAASGASCLPNDTNC